MTSIISSGTHPKELWPGIKKIGGDTYNEGVPIWAQVFEKAKSDKAFEEYLERTSTGLGAIIAEGAGVTYDGTGQGYVTRATNVVYGLGAIVTQVAIEDNQYGSVAARLAKNLARSMRQTKEVVHANILNRAFSSSYVGGDGVCLISTAHPTVNGTQSNKLTVAADMSEASLEDAMTQLADTRDSRGLRIMVREKKLVAASANRWNSTRILSSTNQSGTANNDINAMKSEGVFPGGTVIWPYLSDADAWFIITDIEDGLISQQRRAYAFEQDNDFDTSNARMKATERYVPFWHDWRCIIGSEGA